MTTTRKKFVYTIIILLLVVAATVGTVFTLQSLKNYNDSKTQDTPLKPARTAAETKADNLKDQAIKATVNNELDKAKGLFQEAKQQYEDLGDMNNVSDIDSQLAIVNQLSAQPKTVEPVKPSAGQ
ncbi:hypothetical protein H7X68_03315 [Candidatus Saccharibacteria bacterium]|nr:hypothetical protein [Candidatus Saccharibacteria bacterium]